MRLFKRTKHTSEDRIALQIAEQYGVGEGYIRSRKQGMSPREALEDWDIDVIELENLKCRLLENRNMFRKCLFIMMLSLWCLSSYSQSLEAFANSMNSQSPSAWIQDRFRLMGATYEANIFTVKLDIKASHYFDIDAINNNPKQGKELFGIYIASLCKNNAFASLFYKIIQNRASFTLSVSTPPSKTRTKYSYSPQELTDIINNYYDFSPGLLFLCGHSVATSIGCPQYLDSFLWMTDCKISGQKVIYYVSFEDPDFDYSLISTLKNKCKKLFWGSMVAFPVIDQFVSSCLATNYKICWQVNDSRIKRELFTITFDESELKEIQKIISLSD